jgi:MoaA/NifB/PqqE/SkfB family radical SAM enzyme
MVVVSGGEPTQCEDLPIIIKKLNDNKITISLDTNGTALLNSFPDFYKYINIITLPIEGDIITHASLRSQINFKRVIEILDFLRSNKIGQKNNLQIFINTVALINNVNKLSFIASIVEKYNVDVWKIFEYMHYENINPCLQLFYNAEAVINDVKSIIKNNKTVIRYEKCDMRDNRYFMINPNGIVVIPKLHKGNTFYKKELGSLINDPDSVLKNWEIECDKQKYSDSIKILNMKMK